MPMFFWQIDSVFVIYTERGRRVFIVFLNIFIYFHLKNWWLKRKPNYKLYSMGCSWPQRKRKVDFFKDFIGTHTQGVPLQCLSERVWDVILREGHYTQAWELHRELGVVQASGGIGIDIQTWSTVYNSYC